MEKDPSPKGLNRREFIHAAALASIGSAITFIKPLNALSSPNARMFTGRIKAPAWNLWNGTGDGAVFTVAPTPSASWLNRAARLDADRVIATYATAAGDLAVRVISFNDTTATLGNETVVASSSGVPRVVAFSGTKAAVLITSGNTLQVRYLDINGSVITLGALLNISSDATYSVDSFGRSICALDSADKALVCWMRNKGIYCCVVTSATTGAVISVGTQAASTSEGVLCAGVGSNSSNLTEAVVLWPFNTATPRLSKLSISGMTLTETGENDFGGRTDLSLDYTNQIERGNAYKIPLLFRNTSTNKLVLCVVNSIGATPSLLSTQDFFPIASSQNRGIYRISDELFGVFGFHFTTEYRDFGAIFKLNSNNTISSVSGQVDIGKSSSNFAQLGFAVLDAGRVFVIDYNFGSSTLWGKILKAPLAF